ncbi:MAG TPA: head GIN domain-containing protein [Cyclobacteriaceae bacterium]|nr:head GIN domain-containing protein [Cyclobacteriaceae bacterium]HRX00327.1 head GIN domain-containing protein [Cyclobacteriaceae bacterium]
MRIFVLVGIVLLSHLSGFAQQSEVRSVGSFNGVKAAEAIDVYLKKGDKESVRVEVSGTSLSNVITEVAGSYLKIHMASGNFRKTNVKAYVTYVSLEKVYASSASNVFSEGVIKTSSMDVNVSSAATVELELDAGEVTADVSSAGDIVLEGRAGSLEAEASSAGDIDAYNLESGDVRARASSAGSIKVNATKSLDARASSGGDVRYRGNPMKTNTDSSSGGSVKKSN